MPNEGERNVGKREHIMSKEQMNIFLAYLEEQVTLCKEKEEKLKKEQRTDESIFEKIRGNVFDIFKTIFTVAVKKEQDDTAIRAFFLKKTEDMVKGWKASFEKAAEHNDTDKMQIESIKLEAVGEIRKAFDALIQ